jgi:hypothetical protein
MMPTDLPESRYRGRFSLRKKKTALFGRRWYPT